MIEDVKKICMTKKRSKKIIPPQISPFVWGYLVMLQKKVPIERAYLFGSWAKGTGHKKSDIDMAIVSPSFINWEKTQKKLSSAPYTDLSVIKPHGFHPDDFNPKESPIVEEVLKYGIRVV